MRVRCLLSLLVAWTVVASASPDSVVTINEVNYHPVDEGSEVEWIELHNQMSIEVDLGGWSLRGGVGYDFAEGTVLDAGGFLLVSAVAGQPEGAIGPLEGKLGNGGDEVRLHARHGREMDRLEYGDGGRWPAEADGGGRTLAKRHGDLGSGRARNWAASEEDGGTPGGANFGRQGGVGASRVLFGKGSTWRVLE
ncbi:MAG: lamin tail domain-containing protein, partial [Verrucomicrobiales bacterium]|nr:lamin tail domain-containing protein [Verrucomicrobiales bacterium]